MLRLFRKNLALKIAALTGVLLIVGTAVFLFIMDGLGLVHPVSHPDGIWRLTILFLLYLGAIMAAVMWVVGRTVGRPIHRLIDSMRIAEAGDFLVRARVITDDEIGHLSRKFNEMLSRITDLSAKNIDKERELIVAKEELKYKNILEKKTRIIKKRDRELGERLKDLSILYNINRVVSSTIDIKDLFSVVTTLVTETLGYNEFAILLFDEKTHTLKVAAAHGFRDDEKLMGMEFGLGEGVSGIVAESGRRVLIRDTREDNRYLHYKGEKKEEGSFLSIPIKIKGSVLGVFNFNNPKANGFTSYDIRLLTAVANYLAVAVENSRLYEQTRQLSLTDDLTGLVNRRYFHEILDREWQRAERYGQSLSLLVADIDYFKSFNDTYGHLEGDEVLRDVARLLRQNTRGIDTVGRLGGEEFVVLLPQTGLQEALQVGEKLRRAVGDHSFKTGQEGIIEKVGISMGLSSFPELCKDKETLMKEADAALYFAKRAGRNRVMAYETASQAKLMVLGRKRSPGSERL